MGPENPMPRIVIDAAECIGCESCVEVCPEAFRLNEDAISEFISRDGFEQCIQAAIETCPTECIQWAAIGDLDESTQASGEEDEPDGLA